MLTHIDQGNIADYFSVQSCSYGVGPHCIGITYALMQLWYGQIKATLYRLFYCKNMSVHSGPILYKYVFRALLSQTYLDNIEKTIFLCNVIPTWSIQHHIGYFPHKNCLLALSQHCKGKSLVQCHPRGSRQPGT